MRIYKKFFLLIIMCLLGFLVSCQRDRSKELLNEIMYNMRRQTNFRISMDVKSGSSTISVITEIDIESDTFAKQKVTVIEKGKSSTTYLELKNGLIFEYSEYFGKWYKTLVQSKELTEDGVRLIDIFRYIDRSCKKLSIKEGYYSAGREIELYEVIVDGTAFFKSVFGEDSYQSIIKPYSGSDIKEVFGEVDFIYHVDAKRKQISKLEIDYFIIVKNALPSYPVFIGQPSYNISVTFTFSDFNHINIVLPDIE